MRVLILMLTFLASLCSPSFAEDDVSVGQSVIRSQEQAIGQDDATAAYSFAAPSIRNVFPDADTFMSMVRSHYAPIARHKSFDFGEGKSADGKLTQIVHIVDADGVSWDALYMLERQTDGSLKISGCMLTKLVDARLLRGLRDRAAVDVSFADIERHEVLL